MEREQRQVLQAREAALGLDSTSDRFAQAEAVESLKVARATDLPNLYVLRWALWHGQDASVRAAAAAALAQAPLTMAAQVSSWLSDSTHDRSPLVRETICAAASRLSPTLSLEDRQRWLNHSTRLALHDDIWWVRRAAVYTHALLLAASPAQALPLLRNVLADPFWRVRHAAALALFAIGERQPALRAQIVASAEHQPGIVQSAIQYLRLRWQPEATVHSFPAPLREDDIDNPDPAVVAARLRAMPTALLSPQQIVAYLCNSHETLRASAMAIVRRSPSPPVLRALLPLLAPPGLPHVLSAVTELLDGLGTAAHDLCREVLQQPEPSLPALSWAARFAALTEADDLLPLLLPHAQSTSLAHRAVALEAAAQLRPPPLSLLSASAFSPDPQLASTAVRALAPHADAGTLTALLRAETLPTLHPHALCAVIERARALVHAPFLRWALHAAHPLVQLAAVQACVACELPFDAQPFLHSDDPALREAVLPLFPAHWLAALTDDPDPRVQRKAWACLHSRQAAPAIATPDDLTAAGLASPQAWIRARAVEKLTSQGPAALPRIMPSLLDADLSVRAAATGCLTAWTDAHPQALRAALVEHERAPASHAASASDALLAGLLVALGERPLPTQVPSPQVFEPPTPDPSRRSAVPSSPVPLRRLGQTDLWLSPLAISGAHDLPPSAFAHAQAAGVQTFYWEPTYLSLTHHLRTLDPARRSDWVLIAGTYEADRASIERDVARTLKRLGCAYIDVFLLFWVRSAERLSDEALSCLADLKARGVIRAIGFSTHHRDLALHAVQNRLVDVLMLRHSAAHPGSEATLLPACAQQGIGVIGFSALSYGRLLRPAPPSAAPPAAPVETSPPTASACYRYVLAQPAVTTVLSAPRTPRELRENLPVLTDPPLSPADLDRLRHHGQAIHEEDRRFSLFLRKGDAPDAVLLASTQKDASAQPPDPVPSAPVADLVADLASFAAHSQGPDTVAPSRGLLPTLSPRAFRLFRAKKLDRM